MNKRIVILLSELRGIEGIVNQFRTSFPDFDITPIIFGGKSELHPNVVGWLYVQNSEVKEFAGKFDFSGVNAIFVSFMTGEKVSFIKKAPSVVKLIWAIPGGDLYNRYLRYFGYSILYREDCNLKYVFGKLCRRIPRRREFNYLLVRCSAIVCANCDYSQIEKFAHNHLPAHVYSIAYPMEKMMGALLGKPFVKHKTKRIVVGNSASRTNNHLYVLKCLEKAKLEDIPLSLFLSYGDDERYKADVITKYVKSYEHNVCFITDFLSLDDFNHVLLSATHFIYGNWRQEAVGNILTALYLGGKVYLSRKNPLLEDFREKGFLIYCLEEIGVDFYEELNKDEKTWNRELIAKLYNEERAQQLFKQGLSPFLQG